MLALLRFIAIVAVIFYLSPVRREPDAPRLEEVRAWAEGRLPADAKALWESLPEGAARPLAGPALRQAAGLARPSDAPRPPGPHPAAPRP
jgi:hypothetical protein